MNHIFANFAQIISALNHERVHICGPAINEKGWVKICKSSIILLLHKTNFNRSTICDQICLDQRLLIPIGDNFGVLQVVSLVLKSAQIRKFERSCRARICKNHFETRGCRLISNLRLNGKDVFAWRHAGFI